MADFEAKLCEEVQKYPHLYDSSLREHKDSGRVSNSWSEFASTLETPVEICKKKWRYIREQYVKCKKTAKGKSGDGRKGKSKYDALLEWLSPFVKHRQ